MARALPFQLVDGQKAYAAKLMGNFNYLLGILDNVDVSGLPEGSLDEVLSSLKDLIEQCVASNEVGNARQVFFTDGASLQEKLNNGDLKGADGVTSLSDGMYYFYVGTDGHLYLVTRSEVQGEAFSIDSRGHLIYTVDDPGPNEGDPKTYDLGSVKFDGVTATEFESYKDDAKDYVDDTFASVAQSAGYSVTMLAGSWVGDDPPVSVTISLAAITTTNNFFVGPAAGATETQRAAWRDGLFSVTGQSAGSFELTRDGDAPSVDIPLSVVVFP